MEYRLLGRSGLKVSTITLGTMTMGGKGDFAQVGNVGVKEARRQIDLCLDAGVNLIDTADVYSDGASEEIIGEALGGKRKNGVLIATKARFAMGDGPNDGGTSRYHLIRACEASLKRLRTDVIDLYQLHQWDGADAAGGDARGPRQPGPARPRALHRLLELFRLACDEGARASASGSIASASSASRSTTRWRRAKPNTSCCPSPSTRGWASWSGARWPAASFPASTGATRRRRRARASSPAGRSRRSATRTACGISSMPWSPSARPMASRRRRSRSPGCSAGRGSPRWSSAAGPRRSSRTISPPPLWC